MLTSTLLSTLTLAISVAAGPIVIRDNLIRLPLSKNVNVTEPGHLVKQDQARAAMLRTLGFSNAAVTHSEGVQNRVVSYVAQVEVGTPPTAYSLLIDTGSSVTWVGANESKPYRVTTSTDPTFNIEHGSYGGGGSFTGLEVKDTVSFGKGPTIEHQSIGAALVSMGFAGFDGILGLGPIDLTIGALIPGTKSTIPTVTDNLFTQGAVPNNEVAISFEPTSSVGNNNGELTFGGVDSSKFTGAITFTPITSTSPASKYWGIDQSIRYGASTSILSLTAGIVDTGTTLILIATDAFQRYKSATGAVPDTTTGLLRLTTAQFANLQSLFFNINGVDFELTANAQIWPRALNSAIGGTADNVYLIVTDIESNSGQGLDFLNGLTFLERFYSVYDTTNQQVGIATTSFTHANTN